MPPATAPPSRRTSRRSCASMSCGLREGPSWIVLAGEVVGVFAHVERADEHRAGRFQPLDQWRVAGAGGSLTVDLGTGNGSADRRRRTGSSPRRARRRAANFALSRAASDCLRAARSRPRSGNVRESVEPGFELFDARQRGIDHACRASPPATARAMSAALSQVKSFAMSRLEHRRRLRLVRQRKFRHQIREPERDLEIGFHRRPPCRFHRQGKRRRGSG